MYNWSKNLSHSTYEKIEAKMAELTSNSLKVVNSFFTTFPS
jgi:hypothetical protein